MKKVLIKGNGFSIRNFETTDVQSLSYTGNNKKIWDNMRDIFPHPYTSDDAIKWIDYCATLDPVTNLAIEVEGKAVGGAGFVIGTDVSRYSAEFGYWLGEDYWGKGIMTAAVKLLVPYGFETLEMIRLQAGVFEENKASMRVLEKAGFNFEGILRKSYIKNGVFGNQYQYSIVKED